MLPRKSRSKGCRGFLEERLGVGGWSQHRFIWEAIQEVLGRNKKDDLDYR